jgi:hypothetical protein
LPFFVLASLALLRARFAPPPTHSLFLVAALALRSPLLASLARRRYVPGYSAGNNHGQHKDVVDLSGVVRRSEVVDVFILDPQDSTHPTIKDVSIQPPKFENRVLRSYKNRDLVYSFHESVAGNRKKVQVRPPPVCPLPALL